MKTIKSIITVAVMAGLTTSNTIAQEVTQKASVSPSSCTQYTDSKRKAICLNIADIDYIIEQLPVKLDITKQELTDIQNAAKSILNAIDQHITTSKTCTSRIEIVRQKCIAYQEFNFGSDLHGYKMRLTELEKEAHIKYINAENEVSGTKELVEIRKGYKAQIDAINLMKDLK